VTPRRADPERGAATVLVLALTGVLLLVGSALAVVAALLVDHRAAQAAADLGALAGARSLADGGDGCGVASSVVTANGAAVTSCLVSGREVRLRVVVEGPRWPGQDGDLEAEARAGPSP
jgi:secretion/DNA translocation related TadE-like protein